MYGRETELNLLTEAFHGVQLTGKSAVCVVSGFSGSGKTRLVREALDRMTQEGALTATAKIDQFDPDVPHTAMVPSSLCITKISHQVQCIYDITRQLFFTSSEDLNYFKHMVADALDKDLPALIEMIPLLEKLYPRQELPVQNMEVSSGEAEERTLRLIRNFLTCVATHDRLLVLFIDDVQWSSIAETSLLAGLMTSFREHGSVAPIQNCLLIISYRSNELSEALHQKLFEGLAKFRRISQNTEVFGMTEVKLGPMQLVFPPFNASL